ncbi:MAG: flagellar assembly protein T N-terminal domain-containing protein [Hydrogenovibrio sp.]|uniref:flagellar assembly protein T N-terminal domain-containing protein n=1 Tax=Hydrogenovibrio sp. TaxID=2065821 RepID=UPI00287083FD|nr:flagellar assembly protein T N-terminal domain-containing protein [Hydrogenovibrio sp.]MDR9499345.1 flagellar assembly protein T N-terminal domain-containing protein [Hydrogenovibrio sp.]
MNRWARAGQTAVLVLLLGLSLTVQAKCVVVTGVATLDDKPEAFARQMAIRDALRQATMMSNVKVSSDQRVENYQLQYDRTRFSSQSKVQDYVIVEEGVEPPRFDDLFDENGKEIRDPKEVEKLKLYQVKMEVCLTEDPQACNKTPGNHLQAKLAVAPVVTTDEYAARDIRRLLPGYQQEIMRRLREAGHQNLLQMDTGSVIDARSTVRPNLDRALLEPIRERTGAQYLMLTVVRSLSRSNNDPDVWNDIKRFYNLEVRPNARFIEVETFLVDLVARKQVWQKRHGFNIEGDVTVGRDKPFGTSAFFNTDTGMVFHRLLHEQVSDLYHEVKCKPLTTRIIDIRDDDYVLLLSSESGAKPGDQLAVYRLFGRPVRHQGMELGTDTRPAGFLEIERIQSRFAIAKVVSEDERIEIGDLVKSW